MLGLNSTVTLHRTQTSSKSLLETPVLLAFANLSNTYRQVGFCGYIEMLAMLCGSVDLHVDKVTSHSGIHAEDVFAII
jgi:hypothetical protein